ncbi:Hsp20/alpha crystallin family protein [Plantactinospora sp. B24E8]|uniref:Hsp20/alpha crystallin family protein n=1 Tax=Plantactinospora sp. B24E8 TaxID=3153567 RepID=UPI00325EE739
MAESGRESGRGGTDRGWDPKDRLQTLRAELGRLIDSALAGRGGSPDIELRPADDGWTVIARLPGVAPEEVTLELDDRELCVRARSEAEVNADLGLSGEASGERSFEHRVRLPKPVDADQIDAVMDHGLLTVTLPRAPRPGRRTITIGSRSHDPGRRGRGTTGPGTPPTVVDPAADRELHRPNTAAGTPAPRFTG